MMTVDPWLLDLGSKGPYERAVAQRLANIQASVSNNLGHILALNDPYIRMRITKSARHGIIPPLVVRCLRCTAQASLAHWEYIAGMDEGDRMKLFTEAPEALRATGLWHLRACRGDLAAQHSQEILEEMGRD
jgi:hypothetical protein